VHIFAVYQTQTSFNRHRSERKNEGIERKQKEKRRKPKK
jgi:hypothetical protein